jgi:hypothetical protein
MRNPLTRRKVRQQVEALASLELVVFCGIGVYKTTVFYFPGIDSGLLTSLVVLVPAGLQK